MSKNAAASVERSEGDRRKEHDGEKDDSPRSLVDLDEMRDFRQINAGQNHGSPGQRAENSLSPAEPQNNEESLDFGDDNLATLYGLHDAVMNSHLNYYAQLIDERDRDGQGRGRGHGRDRQDGDGDHDGDVDGDIDGDTLLVTSPYGVYTTEPGDGRGRGHGRDKDGKHDKDGDYRDDDKVGDGKDKPPKQDIPPVDALGDSAGGSTTNPLTGYTGEAIDMTVQPSLHTVQPGETLENIATEHLGSGASDVDVQRHIAEIMHVNKITQADELAAGIKLSLPGHSADGGFTVINSRGERRTNWQDGFSLTERQNGLGTLRLPNGRSVRLNSNEVDSVRRTADGDITVSDTNSRRSWNFDGTTLREETNESSDGTAVIKTYGDDGTVTERHTGPEDSDNYSVVRNTESQVEKVTYPDGTSTEFTYGENGEVKTYRDREGVTWTRTGDSDVFLADKKNWLGLPAVHAGDIQVDSSGNVTVHDDSDGTVTVTALDGSESVDLPSLNPDEFSELLDRNWSRIDKNDDGYLSQEEVDQAVTSDRFTGEDAQMVVALKKQFDELKKLDRNFQDRYRNGISRDDIEEFSELARKVEEEHKYAEEVGQFITENFSVIDKNNDGQIEEDELDDIGVCFTAEGEEMLDHFKDHFDEFRGESDTIDRDMLGRYADVAYKSDDGELYRNIDSAFDSTENSIENQNRDLYGSEDPLDSIIPEAINQGTIGDCYFLSALGSVAANDPESIRDMIEDNGDGTYTVTFPGDPDNPITVDAPTEAELSLYVRSEEHGIWPAVLEKAYGDWKGDTTIPQEAADGGDKIDKGIEILTGRDTDIWTIKDHSTEELDEMLTEAFDNGDSIVVNVRDNPDDPRGGDLPTHHAYSVIGYDPETGTVTIRNPWGHGELKDENGRALDGANDGVFTVSIEEFRERFKHIAVEGNA